MPPGGLPPSAARRSAAGWWRATLPRPSTSWGRSPSWPCPVRGGCSGGGPQREVARRPSDRRRRCTLRPFTPERTPTPQEGHVSKVLLIIGDAAEVFDTLYPLYRVREEGYECVVAGPEAKTYHLVMHERPED